MIKNRRQRALPRKRDPRLDARTGEHPHRARIEVESTPKREQNQLNQYERSDLYRASRQQSGVKMDEMGGGTLTTKTHCLTASLTALPAVLTLPTLNTFNHITNPTATAP